MRKAFVILAALLPALCIGGVAFGSTVDIAAPPNDSTISGDSVQIVVNFEAGDLTPADKVVVKLDGSSVTHRSFDTALPSGSTTFKWDTTRTPNGKHTLDIMVTHGKDILGTAVCEVTVSNKSADHFAPKLKVRNLKEGQTVTGTAPIVVEASDDAGNEPLVSICIDKVVRSVSNRAPFRYDWDTTAYTNGPHYIDISAIDGSDLTSKIKTLRVLVRNPVKAAPLSSRVHGDELIMPSMPPLASKSMTSVSSLTGNELLRASKESARATDNVAETLAASPLPSVDDSKIGKGEALPTINIPTEPVDEDQLTSAPATRVASKPVAKSVVASLPSGTESQAAYEPALAGSIGSVSLSTAPVDENQVTSAPATPVASKPAAKSAVASLPSGTQSPAAYEPALAGSVAACSLSTTASAETSVSTPAVKVAIAHGSASQVEGAPSLADEVSAYAPKSPVASESARISTPAAPNTSGKSTVSDLTVANAAMAGSIVNSNLKTSISGNGTSLLTPDAPRAEASRTVAKISSKPVLMAKLLKSDSEPQVTCDRRLSSPKAVSVRKPACNVCSCSCKDCHGKCAVCDKSCAKKSAKCRCMKSIGVRAAFKAAGGSVIWNGKKRTVHATAPNKDLKLKIGSRKAEFNSKTVKMDRSAFICNGRTMISGSFAKNTLQILPEKK
jgi:hypothetical protein